MTIAPQHRVYACFFLFAFMLGALLSRLPDLQVALGVTEGELGLTIVGISIGSLVSMTLSSPLIARLGARRTAFITVFGAATCFAVVPLLPAAPMVFAVLVVAGLFIGALEINLNVEADRIEGQYGRPVMNRAHGFWSLGFFLTAMVGAGVRQAGIPPWLHLGVAFCLVIGAGVLMISGMRNAAHRPGTETQVVQAIAFPNAGLLPLCMIGIAAFLVEGAGIDWSAIYMRDVFAVEPFVGGLSLTLFAFFMAIARLSADPVVARIGSRLTARVLLGLATAGIILVGVAPGPYWALAGFSLLGVGCSAVYPLAVSAAAQRTDRPSAVNVAAIGQVTFIVFFLAPPLLGFAAQYLGIRNAYLVCLPVVLIGLLVTRALPARQPRPLPPGMPPTPATPLG